MITIERILCPIDFSDVSRHALDHAIVLARWYKARLIALYAHQPIFIPVPEVELAGYVGTYVPEQPNGIPFEAEVVSWLEPATRAGISVEALVQTGVPVDRILGCAASEHADLIVMGTHGIGGFEHLILGSTTEKVLRKATCPVLTIPPRAQATSKLPYERVLCPVDFSEPSRAAVELACSLVKEAHAELTLLHVIEWPSADEPIATRSFNVPEYTRYREEAAQEELDKLSAASVHDGRRPATRLGRGKPYREILGAADQERADLIVMGVHGRNALDVMLFGSTTNQVVRRATCPVLTLRG